MKTGYPWIGILYVVVGLAGGVTGMLGDPVAVLGGALGSNYPVVLFLCMLFIVLVGVPMIFSHTRKQRG